MSKIIIVSGPVIVENGKVLLNKHGDPPDFWKFCGGTVENDETDLKHAAIREAKEEAGIDLEFADQQPFFLYVKKQTPQGPLDVILVHWLAKRVGEVKPGPDILQTEWLDISTLALRRDLSPNILPALRHFGLIG